MTILQELIQIRRSGGLSQVEVADRMGMSRQQLSNIENGRQGCPSISLVERYAEAIGVRLVVKSK
jgi:transcriptional regulator with XRE-family HTH domain